MYIGVFCRHGKTGGSSRVRVGSIRLGWVGLTRVFHMNFFKYFYKENNMYLPFGKLCNKLLDVKCIILSLPLISRMNSVKLINTYSIILKLYKSQHCYLKQNNTKISKINT